MNNVMETGVVTERKKGFTWTDEWWKGNNLCILEQLKNVKHTTYGLECVAGRFATMEDWQG
jgi:hypothetical protein